MSELSGSGPDAGGRHGRRQIRAVGISTYWHSLLGLDADGSPLTPIYNWADTRAGAVAQRLRRDLDAEAIHERTGCVIHPSYYPAKLVWLRETQPELFPAGEALGLSQRISVRRWFGAQATQVSVSMASGTGLFHQEKRRLGHGDAGDDPDLPGDTLADRRSQAVRAGLARSSRSAGLRCETCRSFRPSETAPAAISAADASLRTPGHQSRHLRRHPRRLGRPRTGQQPTPCAARRRRYRASAAADTPAGYGATGSTAVARSSARLSATAAMSTPS